AFRIAPHARGRNTFAGRVEADPYVQPSPGLAAAHAGRDDASRARSRTRHRTRDPGSTAEYVFAAGRHVARGRNGASRGRAAFPGAGIRPQTGKRTYRRRALLQGPVALYAVTALR